MTTIPASERSISYAPVASTGPFPVTFPVFDETGADLRVSLDNVEVGGWTFAGELVSGFYGDPSTWVNGSITFTAPITGALDIDGLRTPQRESQFAEGRGIPARDQNTELNILTATDQELRRDVDRTTAEAVRVPRPETGFVLPVAAARSGKLLGFGAGGEPNLVTPDLDGNGTIIADSIVDALEPGKDLLRAASEQAQRTLLDVPRRTTVDVRDFGALWDGTGAQLSTRYGSLAAAQAVYPFVTSLTQTIDWAAINAAWRSLPAGGGTVILPPGVGVVREPIVLGNGGPSGKSTITNIQLVGGGAGAQANVSIPAATNSTIIRMMSPSVVDQVILWSGPISMQMRDFAIDVNNLATVGIQFNHTYDFVVEKINIDKYRASGMNFLAYENPTAHGVYQTTKGSVSNCIISNPQLSSSIGVVVGWSAYGGTGVLDVARVQFLNVEITCGDSQAGAGYEFRYCDNISVTNGFIYSQNSRCTPFKISPPSGLNAYPQIITISNCPTFGIQTWPNKATWNPGRRGILFNPLRAENIDRLGLPLDIENRVKGVDKSGNIFGGMSGSCYDRDGVYDIVNTAAESLIGQVDMDAFTLGTHRSALIRTIAVFRNATGSSQTLRLRGRAIINVGQTAVPAGSYTCPVDGNVGRYHAVNSASPTTITLPTGPSQARYHTWFRNFGAGAGTIIPGPGATINGGATPVNLPSGSAVRCVLENDNAWTVLGVTLDGYLFDTGALTEVNLGGYRSLEIECRYFATNGSELSQATLTRVSKGGAVDLNSLMQPRSTDYAGITNNLAIDSWAPLSLMLYATPGVASAFLDLHALTTELEIK